MTNWIRTGAVALGLSAVLAAAQLVNSPDASAATTGSITGTVTDATTHLAIEGVEVCAGELSGATAGCDYTNATGEYAISALNPGSYKVDFITQYVNNYVRQFYNAKPTSGEADLVSVSENAETGNIDAELHHGSRIVGAVSNVSTGLPIEHIDVCAYVASTGEYAECGYATASGEYEIKGLAPGSYKVEFFSPALCGEFGCQPPKYIRQFYKEKPSLAEAEPLTVGSETTLGGINASMQQGGYISGTVIDAESLAPVEGVLVCAYPIGSTVSIDCEISEPNGEYLLGGMATGSYLVEFTPDASNTLGYQTQFYEGQASLDQANPVSVTVETTHPDIDALMSGPGPLRRLLSITKSGTGTIAVMSSPSGIDCGLICRYAFSTGTTITLTAIASPGSRFDGWAGGGCSGTGPCQITLNSNTEITAHVSLEEGSGSEEKAQTEEHQEPSATTPGNGAPTASQPPAPPAPSKPASKKPRQKHVLKCRKGFKKQKVHGKTKHGHSEIKCVKVKGGR